jgi:hypothetical protein
VSTARKLQIKPDHRVVVLGAPDDVELAAARRDALAWVAYPKGGQRGTDLNRGILASLLAEHGVRAVRQIAIDATWSVLRFRPGE